MSSSPTPALPERPLRVLIVAFYFPPAGGGGVQRVLKWCRYLQEFGIEPHVLTPDDPRWIDEDPDLEVPAGTTVHRARYVGLRPGQPGQLLHGLRGARRILRRLALQPRRFLVPDVVATWRLTAIRRGVRVVREHDIDVVLSTSPPATDHVVAAAIARRTERPLACDLRDSWLADPRLRTDRRSVALKQLLAARMERRSVGRAGLVTTAADSISEEVRARHGSTIRQVLTIRNGADAADFAADPALDAPPERFVVTHTGGFYGLRRPGRVLDAIEAMPDRQELDASRILLRFVGQLPAADAERIARSPRLAGCVEHTGFVPYRQALAHQLAADCLLLLVPDTPDRQGMVTGKLFEYLLARRRILALVPPNGAAAELVRETGSGVVVQPDDVSGIVAALCRIAAEVAAHGPVLDPLDGNVLAEVSRRGGAERLAGALRGLAAKQAGISPR